MEGGRVANFADRGPNPRTVVVKALDAIVVDTAVVGPGRLVVAAGLVVPHDHFVAVDHYLCGSAGGRHLPLVRNLHREERIQIMGSLQLREAPR